MTKVLTASALLPLLRRELPESSVVNVIQLLTDAGYVAPPPSVLKRCPFCGQEPRRNNSWQAWCEGTQDAPHENVCLPIDQWEQRYE